MQLQKIDDVLKDTKVWIFLSFILLGYYLSPLFQTTFYVPVYDNLDSKVVWYKILAESGKIFAKNHTIIPNMMNGLPRLSYGSEFDLLLWFYYIFGPKTAYILNEIFIHLLAFISMFMLLKRYVVPQTKTYRLVPAFVGSLYFALLPFWSGSGASIALLPLATYSLLNIKNKNSTLWDWIFLILIPFYSSFILTYIFYIALAGLYFFYDSIKHKKVNFYFFSALFLFGMLYLLKNYRLFEALFFDPGFISHRTEFKVFYNVPLWEFYRLSLVNFLECHIPHAQTLTRYILPTILISMLLSLFRRKLSTKESMVIWIIILLSFVLDIWSTLLIHRYTLPFIALFSLFLLIYNKDNRKVPALMILIIILSFAGAAQMYEGFKGITHYIPTLKTLNFRIHFLLPFIYAITFSFALKTLFKTLKLSALFSLVFISAQFYDSLNASYFTTKKRLDYASFQSYYATNIFKQIKQDLKIKNPQDAKFISYGIEPAVSLYNDLYTVDGYSTNYPLSYKHKFKKVQVPKCFTNVDRKKVYDDWGSKAYLLCMDSRPQIHKLLHNSIKAKNTKFPFFASIEGLCNLNTNYILSGTELSNIDTTKIQFIKYYHSKQALWHIWLYKLNCSNSKYISNSI